MPTPLSSGSEYRYATSFTEALRLSRPPPLSRGGSAPMPHGGPTTAKSRGGSAPLSRGGPPPLLAMSLPPPSNRSPSLGGH